MNLFRFWALAGVGACSSALWAAPPSVPYTWRNVEINGGGFMPSLVFHPRERDLIYARADIGGAYKWNPRLKRWTALTDEFGPRDWNLYGVESIGLDPNNPDRVYLAVGTYTNDWAGNGAILRSFDRGQTWKRTDLPFKNGGNEAGRSMGERLVVDPRDGNTLFFGTRHNGLWKSSDAGATWRKIASPAPDDENGIGLPFLLFDAKHTLLAGVASKTLPCLFSSSDGGATWTPVPGAPVGVFPHHAVFASDGTLYLSVCNGLGPNDVTDGSVWKRSASGAWTNISPSAGRGFGWAGLAVDARRPGTVMVSTLDRWAQGDDVFRSLDGGATWTSLQAHSTRDSSLAPYLNWGKPAAELGHWIGDLEIDPFDSNRALYVTGATVWGTNDLTLMDRGQTTHWSVAASGIEENAVGPLLSPPVGPHLVSGMGDIGGFVHDDLTQSPRAGMMSPPRLSNNTGLDFAALAPSLLVRVGQGQGAFSRDAGATWTPFPSSPLEKMNDGTVAVSADGKTWLWSAASWNSPAGGAYWSRDGGASWAKCQGLPPQARVLSDRVTPGVFFCLDAKAKQWLVSTDGGATFSPRGLVPPEGAARRLRFARTGWERVAGRRRRAMAFDWRQLELGQTAFGHLGARARLGQGGAGSEHARDLFARLG